MQTTRFCKFEKKRNEKVLWTKMKKKKYPVRANKNIFTSTTLRTTCKFFPLSSSTCNIFLLISWGKSGKWFGHYLFFSLEREERMIFSIVAVMNVRKQFFSLLSFPSFSPITYTYIARLTSWKASARSGLVAGQAFTDSHCESRPCS